MRITLYVMSSLCLALVCGCETYPIAKNFRLQAQELSLTQAQANPKTIRGTMVIWGGRILNTFNGTNGGEMYILQLPLTRNERPVANDSLSGGRFIALSSEFLDPAAYPRGHLVTIAGRLDGVRNERLQHTMYLYPVVKIEQIHIWNERKQDYYYYNGGDPGWYWGYSPVWWDGGVGWYNPAGYGGQSPGLDEDTRSSGSAK